MKHTARTLLGKALSSLRSAMTSFNSPHNDGRVTSVLLHLQHAFEMLLGHGAIWRPVVGETVPRPISAGIDI